MPTRRPSNPALAAILLLATLLVGCQTKPAADPADAPTNDAAPRAHAAQPDTPTPGPAIQPNTKLSQTPGSPMVLEEVTEASADVPMTVPIVDPTVTTPTPTVTDTPIPTQLVGLQYQGAVAGGNKTNKNHPVDVFGNRANARNIAFLIDASGSMQQALPFATKEINRAVSKLNPAQNITIIVFSGEGTYEVPGGGAVKGLRSTTPKFKEDIAHWLDLKHKKYKTGGSAGKNAEKAVLRAMRYKPQLIYILSDTLTGGGQGATKHELNQDALMKSIAKANDDDKPTRFHTIQFFKEDPLVAAGLKGTLQLLAEDTGGNYKFISKRDLKLR